MDHHSLFKRPFSAVSFGTSPAGATVRKMWSPALLIRTIGERQLLLILLLGAALRLAVGAWNSFIGPTPGAESDALAFHQMAVEIAHGQAKFEFAIGWVYAQFLGLVYTVTSPHIFIACALSTAAWFLSAYVLVLIMRRLDLPTRVSLFIATAYAFLPSSLFNTSVPLREAYQLLFLNLMALGLLDMFDRQRSPASGLIMFIGSAILAGLLHGVLILVGIAAAVGAAAAIVLSPHDQFSARYRRLSIALLLAFVSYSSFLFITYSYGAELTGAGPTVLNQHRILNAQVRMATYVDQEQGTFRDPGLAVAFFQYLFEPMPWRQLRPHDYIAVAENALRGAMLLLSVYGLFRLRGRQRVRLVLLLSLYFCLEGLWALGTSNWGTALRHHVPSWGLLLVAGSCFMLQKARTPLAEPIYNKPIYVSRDIPGAGLPEPLLGSGAQSDQTLAARSLMESVGQSPNVEHGLAVS